MLLSSLFWGGNLLHYPFKTWNISHISIPHLSYCSTLNLHKPYDTLIVDTLKPGQVLQLKSERKKERSSFLYNFISGCKNCSWLFSLPPFRLRKRFGLNRESSWMRSSKYLDTTSKAAQLGLKTTVWLFC